MTAGDEFGHSQLGNNNAYAQDNAITWRNWDDLNQDRLDFTRAWAELRKTSPLLGRVAFLEDEDGSANPEQVSWLGSNGQPMTPAEWEDPDRNSFMMVLGPPGKRLTIVFNRSHQALRCVLPASQGLWCPASPGASVEKPVPPRSVVCWQEMPG